MVFKGDNVVGAFMNVPIFVGTFFVVTDFSVLEDMDAYHDEGMGDFIVGEPFLREVGIKARWFNGMITIYNGDDEDLVKEISTDIGGEFTNLEILNNYGVLENISKRRAFWSLNKDLLKINDSDNQYAVSIKEDMAFPYLYSPKTTKE
ncbi:hypothetical protein Tco_0868594 [Tanacetum coccineum]